VKKLKSMNEISAREAVKLFRAALVLDAKGQYRLILEACPQDITIKALEEIITLCLRMESNQRDKQADLAVDVPNKSLEELMVQLSPPQRKVFDRIVDGSHPRLKDLDDDETLISDETGKKMAEGTIKAHVSAICWIFSVPNRKALVAKVKQLLSPKAK
jgi:hypothetical protein